MANKAIKSTSGFRPRSEEETEMRRGNDETSLAPRCAAAGAATCQLSDFRAIDSRELDGSAYIGEGNATLVVSLPHDRKVLRFRKSEDGASDATAENGGKRRAELLVDFFKNVVSGLMGRYASEPEIVRCNPEDVARWMSVFETQRPDHRRHKKVVDRFATVLPDYTLLPGYLHDKLPSGDERPTFCVEIKPKQGFVDEEVAPLRGKCDYCRKQYTKLAEGKISSPSKYCPCDLFSGEADRMRRAVRGLAESPQNNFRIFRDGRLIWGEDFEPTQLDNALAEWFFHGEPFDREAAHELMFRLIREALLRPFPRDQRVSPSTASGELADVAAERSLPEDSVLGTIFRVQRLNNRSIDSVHAIYSAHSGTLNDEMVYSKTKALISGGGNPRKSTMLPSEEELLTLRNYLLFRIAKDCSILMAFRDVEPSAIPVVAAEHVIRLSESRCFLFNNAITDLDPKSVHSIAKHHRRRTAEMSKVASQGQGAWSEPSGATR